MLRRAGFALVLLAAACGVYGFQQLVDSRTDRSPEVKLRYLLATRNVRRASFGYPQVAADLIWIKAIQFYHQQFVKRLEAAGKPGTAKLLWLDKIADLVTDLNPRFVKAYYFFSIYQAGNEEVRRDYRYLDEDASPRLRLLRKGLRNNPHTYFLANHLFGVYLTFYNRVTAELERGQIDPELAERLLAHHRERCVHYLRLASQAPDAPDLIKLSLPRLLNRFAGDPCEGYRILETRYDQYTQDVERFAELGYVVRALDTCHVHELEALADERGAELQPGTAKDLAAQLGQPVPSSPWSALERFRDTDDEPPESFAALLERYRAPIHRYEYFVSMRGQILSWAEGERREATQLGLIQGIIDRHRADPGYVPWEISRVIDPANSAIKLNPFGRAYLADPFAAVPLAQRVPADLVAEVVRPYEAAEPEARDQLLPRLVRQLDATQALQLQHAVDPVLATIPPTPGLGLPELQELLGDHQIPRSPWGWLDQYGGAPPERIPGTLAELRTATPPLPPGSPPDYLLTPAGRVMARAVAERLHSDLQRALQRQLDQYREQRHESPADLGRLRLWGTPPLPLSPLGADFRLSEDGTTVLSP
jgi:hypothetical protein